jgi:polysaccharide deacetylase family protein (PEP-CTERM system associated)
VSFRQDLLQSKDALEQVTGAPVLGFRAPTFSIMAQTSWAIDVLAEAGMRYDSSIFPVRHDRYGVPKAPRTPFRVRGTHHELLELPPATFRCFGMNLPVGGGGYFRLFPLMMLEAGIRQLSRLNTPNAIMLYFHPWEFDPEQEKLPLGRLSKWRTYVGINRSRGRLLTLMRRYQFQRAIDVVDGLQGDRNLEKYAL